MCVMILISILWMPVIVEMQGGQLFIYIQAISAYLSPPIAAVYLIAVLSKRANEKVRITIQGFLSENFSMISNGKITVDILLR